VVGRIKIILSICLLFSQLSIAEQKDYSKEERKVINRSVAEVIYALKKEMKEQFGLICIGTGGGMPYDIEEIGVDFVLHQQTSIEEARELEIRATERFVEIINAHEAIRPYLRDYPWDHNRADVMIAFDQVDGKDFPEGVRLVLQARNQLIYYGPKRFPNDIAHLKEESYDEAKKIVENNPSCLKPFIAQPKQKKRWFDWW
jgi:hypothetical protein